MEVEMKIRGLMMDPVTNMPIVILKDVNGNTVLTIWVGVYEANAIALEIEKVSTPRPMTHDLINSICKGFNISVERAIINDLKNNTYYARLILQQENELGRKLVEIDARPGKEYLRQFKAVCRLARLSSVPLLTLAAAAAGTPPDAEVKRLTGLVRRDSLQSTY